jgi:predicted permease
MRVLIQDLRFALRQLGRAPSFAVTAVLTLALGIGANTAIFSVVNNFVLKPLPVDRPDRLAELGLGQNKGGLFPYGSWWEYKAIREQTPQTFSAVFCHELSMDGIATPGQQPQRIMTSFVSGNFFSGLGLKPAAGRLFTSSEGEILGQDPVLVLDYDYWKTRFNGDPGAIGRTVSIDGHPLTIIGVAPRSFHGVMNFVTPAVYMPVSQMTVEGVTLDGWQNRQFQVYGRLRPGVSLRQASAALGVLASELARLHPVEEKDLILAAFAEQDQRVSNGDGGATMKILSALFLALAGMVLLLACVNVANLVLVRATEREREMAIRTALGAGRARLLRQTITESVVLALIGGGLGMVLGIWASSALGHLNVHADMPLSLDFGLDWRIFLYSFLAALAAGVAVGVIPAVRSARTNINTVLHEGGRGVTRGRSWFRSALVVLQLAGSLVLLAVAALFVRSLSAMQTTDLGFRPDHVLNAVVDPTEIGMNDAQSRNLAREILTRLEQIGGVEAVSHSNTVPLGYFNNAGETVQPEGAATPDNSLAFGAGDAVVSPDYLRVMGIDLLRGRAFSSSDDEHGRDVAIVSEIFARKYWPNQDPIGRIFTTGSEKTRKLEVVGVARDAEFTLWGGGKTRPFFYLPYAQHPAGNSLMVFQLRTAGDPSALAPEVEKAIHELAPGLPVFQVQSMRQALYTLNGLLLFQIGAALAAIMGGLGLTLAIIGLYGVVSYAVSRRTHEIGLRIALGASRGDLFRMVYRQSLWMIAGGLALGLALALLAARAASSFVIVSVWDPATYALVCSALAFTALASCYFPARRAMSLDPMAALRED